MSLESHSSKLNQSQLFDSIQAASRAEEGRKRAADNESRANFDKASSLHRLSPSFPLLFLSPFRPPTPPLEARIIGSHFMLRHSRYFLQTITSTCFWDIVGVS